ncbi:MAG: sulfatase-like hydrolase/transferase [Puniceicoccaceae bacterium]|nr:sulfatase-like hydrolase/transferase [Puniceicoccaceae bacterium]
MRRLPYIISLCGLCALAAQAQATSVGAYWAFQVDPNLGPSEGATFTGNISVDTWPNGSPSFSYSGSQATHFGNFGSAHTAHDGSVWVPGRAFGWDANAGASTGNSFQMTLDTLGLEDIAVQLKYRLNGVQSSSGLVAAFSAFEYSVNGAAFVAVAGAPLALDNNTSFNNLWQADLSALAAIENAGAVTLRWTFSDLLQATDARVRIDDLEVTALGPADSNPEVLELRRHVGTYSPSSLDAETVTYSLSGSDAAAFSISSSGVLSFVEAPVYGDQVSYRLVVTMTDTADPANTEQQTVRVTILESAAITTRLRHHPADAYNVLFIPIDDLRPLINIYGEDEPLRPITPNFDRLAESSVTFLNAHCQQAICTASRVSFLTGLRPDTTRNWNLRTRFRDLMPDVTTLPQHFKEHGYTTYGVGKIFHGQSATHQDESNSWSEGWHNPGDGRFKFYERGDNPGVWNTWNKAGEPDASSVSATDVGEYKRDGVTPIGDTDYEDGRAAELAIQKIAEYAGNGTRFFLGLGFQKPHLPFNAPKAYWDLYDPDEINLSGYTGNRVMPVGTNAFTAPYGNEPLSYGDGETYLPTVFDNTAFGQSNNIPSQASARHLIHGYLACVSFIDAQLGKVLDALEDPNGDGSSDDSIADETIIVLFGDHGFHLGDHGGFWSKHTNFEISTRVPFMVRTPALEALGSAGKMTQTPIELVDLFPTLLDLCSLPVPDTTTSVTTDIVQYQVLEGTTFLPLLEDPEQPWKSVAFSQYQRSIQRKTDYPSDVAVNSGNGAGGSGKGMGYSIRTDRYRYTEWWRTNGDYGQFGDSNFDPDGSRVISGVTKASFVELYDYQNDPRETENLAVTQPAANADLIVELQGLLHDSDSSDYVGDGWKKDLAQSPYNVPADYPVTKTEWAARHFSPGRDMADLADEADPDLDGLQNLLEYALGTHPFEPNRENPVALSHAPGAISIQYPEVRGRSDVRLVPQSSPMLEPLPWSPAASTTTGTVGEKDMKEASINTDNTKGFLRLRAENAQ